MSGGLAGFLPVVKIERQNSAGVNQDPVEGLKPFQNHRENAGTLSDPSCLNPWAPKNTHVI